MKEKVKIWSRRRLLGAFLAFLGLAAVANAQTSWPNSGNNGTVAGMCGGELFAVTRTIDELNDGTDIEITFTGVSHGDSYYFIAATGGSLTEVTCDETIGKYLNITSDGDGDLPNVVNPVQFAGSFTATDIDNGLTADERKKTITVKHTDPENNTGGVFKLGVFVYSAATGCYSDAYYITINVLNNIYAYLLLNNGSSHQYICNGEQTMAIGFELCNLPVGVNGTLKYNVLASSTVTNADISGKTSDKLAISDNATDNDGAIQLTVNTAEENVTLEIQPTALESDKRQVVIGAQELVNASASIAGQMEFSFPDEMTFTYNVTENDANGQERTRTVVLPVIFQTANQCGTDGYGDGTTENPYITDNVFTVHVAPSFKVQALAYATEGDRPTIEGDGSYVPGSGYNNTNSVFTATTTLSEPTFCQGTIAYLFGETSASEGKTTYAWANSTDPVAANNTTFTNAAIQNPNTAELTEFGNNAYTLLLTGTWNDLETDGHYGAGCQITDLMPINVNAAPILLLATDKATSGDDQTWNSTDVITYTATVCPGELIKIETDDAATILETDDDNDVQIDGENTVDPRYNYMIAGDYIKANGATLKYTVNPNAEDPAVGAYTTWRTQLAPATTNLNVAHYLNNGTAAQANITYTVENSDANGCKLVKSDGSSLTNGQGQVQIVFPVQPRPQFQLGAN